MLQILTRTWHNCFTSIGELLPRDAAEQARHSEVVVLAPMIRWMMMAFRALKSHAQEDLTDASR